MLALNHAFLSGTSRLQLPIPLRGPGPRVACRRRALVAQAVKAAVCTSVSKPARQD
jgi:hypothetical protein